MAVKLMITLCLLVLLHISPIITASIRSRGRSDDTCWFNKGEQLGNVTRANGELVGCFRVDNKNCGEDFRFLPEGEECDEDKEVEVAWNQVGPEGPKGDTGSSCSVTSTDTGAEIVCGDESLVEILNGINGTDGSDCSVTPYVIENISLGAEISCGDDDPVQVLDGAIGPSGADGQNCSVLSSATGATITCGNDAPVSIQNGNDGADGTNCAISSSAGGADITCGNDTVTVYDGDQGPQGNNGTSCSVAGTQDGANVTCGDDTVTIYNGEQGPQGSDGASCSVTSTQNGANVTCGDDTVSISNGNDGTDATTVDLPCFDDVNRFVDCENGSIHDQFTGLIWLSKTNCRLGALGQGTGHAEAYRAAATLLQDGYCGLSDSSKPGDWRLPTEDEASAVMSTSCGNPSVPDQIGTGCTTDDTAISLWTFASNPAVRNFPTSTYDESDNTKARWGNLLNGSVFSLNRGNSFSVTFWAVRSLR